MGYFSDRAIEGNYSYAYDANRTIGDRMNPGPRGTFQVKQRVRIASLCDPLHGKKGTIAVAQGNVYKVQLGWQGVWAFASALVACE